MSAVFFMYWLKGFLTSIELRGNAINSEEIDTIIIALELAIKAEQSK